MGSSPRRSLDAARGLIADPGAPELRVTSKYTFALKLAIKTPIPSLVRFIATEPTPHAATRTASLSRLKVAGSGTHRGRPALPGDQPSHTRHRGRGGA